VSRIVCVHAVFDSEPSGKGNTPGKAALAAAAKF